MKIIKTQNRSQKLEDSSQTLSLSHSKTIIAEEDPSLRLAVQIIVVLLSLAIIVMLSDKKKIKINYIESPRKLQTQTTRAVVQQNWQFIQEKKNRMAKITELENQVLASNVNQKNYLSQNEMTKIKATNPFESEDRVGQVLKDLNSLTDRKINRPILPEDRIASILEQEQWLKKYDKDQQEVFVQQFLKNALAAGYKINLNNKLQVIGVQRIPNGAITTSSSANTGPILSESSP